MYPLLLIPYYFKWHYGQGTKDLFHNISIFISFVFSWFSVKELFSTLFAPWKRLGDEYQKGFHPQQFFGALLVNSIMRVVGFVVRLTVIISGSIATVFAALISFGIAFVWIFYPLVLAFFITIFIKMVL